jgi:hypothetical protein
MPIISFFYGIVISMFHNDHGKPHFHARYSGRQYVFLIDPFEVAAGSPPPRIAAMLQEWTEAHRDELLYNWKLCMSKEPPQRVAPLD